MTAPNGQPDTAIEALRRALGLHYEIIRRVGIGGMGSVYLARDLRLDRDVAVKVINPDVASNAAMRERFLQEARTVAKLRNPGIVSVYAAGETDGMLYFVMEYVPGESLREQLTREGKLDLDVGARIVREVALALDDAHGHGLVHRDVKPENILIDGTSGRAMLTDFGVARAFEKEGGMTLTGMILGSPRYMSPEQASGDRVIDGRSDLYALALVGYEVFTGAAVMQANSVAAILVKQLTETPVPLGEKIAALPPHVAHAIDRGLAKNPDERWQTGREFASAIAGGELTPTGERNGATLTGMRSAKATKKAMPMGARVGALVAVFAGLLTVIISSSRQKGGDLNSYIVAPFEIQSGDATVTWLREGSANMLTLALSQWTDLKVVDYERTLSLLDDEKLGDKSRLSLDDALGLARRANAGVVVTGQVQTTTDSLRVIAKLYNVRSGDVMEQAQEAGVLTADPRPVFDRLARQLLQIKGGPNAVMELTAVTTSSIAAYRAYLDGVRYLNSWRLQEADSAFGEAIARDSTFALAFHKRTLTLGWSEAGGVNYQRASERAFALSPRLPARERALVEGHYHLVQGLLAGTSGKPAEALVEYDKAIAVYQDLTARDSLVPEAWYGLADAYFHGRSGDNPALATKRASLSMAGFHHTLAIDSSFHLAYSHLVQLYNNAASGNAGFVIDADTAILVQTPADIARLGGAERVAQLRSAAAAKGIQIARAWVRSDEGAAQPVLQLAQSFVATGAIDSALAVLHDAQRNPNGADAKIAAMMIPFQMMSADTSLVHDVPALLDRFTVDSMNAISALERFKIGWSFLAAAAMTGNSADVARAAKLTVAADPVVARTAVPSAPLVRWNQTILSVAMGAPVTPDVRRSLATGVRALDAMDNPVGTQGRNMSMSAVYLGFLATKDPLYRSMLGKWSNGRLDTTLTELDALVALDKRDTTTAQRIAATFPSPDSLRNARFGFGGMRTVARAEVLTRLGLVRQAAESYEATSPVRFNDQAATEPGYAVWVRTLHDRARLWVQLGEREKAIIAYNDFIRRWRNADGAAAEQVALAKRELSALLDAPNPKHR